jgi:hypothetical protein
VLADFAWLKMKRVRRRPHGRRHLWRDSGGQLGRWEMKQDWAGRDLPLFNS